LTLWFKLAIILYCCVGGFTLSAPHLPTVAQIVATPETEEKNVEAWLREYFAAIVCIGMFSLILIGAVVSTIGVIRNGK